MKAKEEYSIRCEMSDMHEVFIERMSDAYDKGFYVEAVWFCYAIFEQRISRLIAKYIDKCDKFPERTDDSSASISIRIGCLINVINAKYGAFECLDVELFKRIKMWCRDRNALVHGLISLDHYKKFDDEFKLLAETGVTLVFELYDACTDFRKQWYKSKEINKSLSVKKCSCKNYKCINPKCI